VRQIFYRNLFLTEPGVLCKSTSSAGDARPAIVHFFFSFSMLDAAWICSDKATAKARTRFTVHPGACGLIHGAVVHCEHHRLDLNECVLRSV
jgi:hypothetical protein